MDLAIRDLKLHKGRFLLMRSRLHEAQNIYLAGKGVRKTRFTKDGAGRN